jgi:catechol 2,3-dioxygenase-like lactoylglutathione lyase family enzyme
MTIQRVVGLGGVRVDTAFMQTPDGNGRLELIKFLTPSAQGDNRHAPANTLGLRHLAFAVEDIDAVVAGVRALGAELVGELERYGDSYRLCSVRGPDWYRVELIERGSPA